MSRKKAATFNGVTDIGSELCRDKVLTDFGNKLNNMELTDLRSELYDVKLQTNLGSELNNV